MRALVVVAAALALVAGCGGDGAGEDGVPPGETFEQLVSRAEAIVDNEMRRLGNATTPQALAEQASRLAGETEDTAGRLEESEAPDELTEEKDRLVASLRDLSGQLDALAERAEAGETESALHQLDEVPAAAEAREAISAIRRVIGRN